MLPNGTVSKDPLTKEVRHLILSGLTVPEITAATGAGTTLIYNQRQALRKAGHKLQNECVYNGGKRTRASTGNQQRATSNSAS